MQKNLPNHIKRQIFAPSELIPLQSEHLWLLQLGVVKVSAWTQEGNPLTLGYWGKDDLIGKPLNLVHPCRAKCMTYVEAFCIPMKQIGCIADLVVKNTQQTEELLSILHSETIYERLCNMLAWLGRKFGIAVEIGILIDLRITHQDLAETIGATRVSVTKLINQLEKESFLTRPERNSIILLNQPIEV